MSQHKGFLFGLIAGAVLAGWTAAQATAPPTTSHTLCYGRTAGGVNVPVKVDSSGIVQTHAN